jgi:hypothetical protein
MWSKRSDCYGGTAKFFALIFGNNTLLPYYATNSSLMINYKYSLYDLENMLPWERDLYIAFIEEHIRRKNNIVDTGLSDE